MHGRDKRIPIFAHRIRRHDHHRLGLANFNNQDENQVRPYDCIRIIENFDRNWPYRANLCLYCAEVSIVNEFGNNRNSNLYYIIFRSVCVNFVVKYSKIKPPLLMRLRTLNFVSRPNFRSHFRNYRTVCCMGM